MNFIKKTSILLCIAFISSASFAKESYPVLSLDIEKIANESKVGKDMQEKMQKKQSILQSKIEDKKKEISTKIDTINKQKSKISEAEYNKKVEALQRDVATLDGKFQADLQELNDKQVAASQKLVDIVKGVVKVIANDKKASIVLPSNMVFYSDEKYDITPEVIKALDRDVKTIEIE
jgi:outer membrane protein